MLEQLVRMLRKPLRPIWCVFVYRFVCVCVCVCVCVMVCVVCGDVKAKCVMCSLIHV